MSNDAPEYYNAWVNIMEQPEHQLLCTWHIDRNWRKNLQKIHGDQEFKAKIYKSLRLLLQEQNVDQFQEMLEFIMEELVLNENTKY